MTTHVICNSCSMTEYDQYKQFQDVHIVNPNFLLKSLKYKSKEVEKEFEVKPANDAHIDNGSFLKKKSSYSSATQGFDLKQSNFKIEGVGFSLTQTQSYIRPFDEADHKIISNPLFRRSNSSHANQSNHAYPDQRISSDEKKIFSKAVSKSKTQTVSLKPPSNNDIKFKSLLFRSLYFYFNPNSRGLSKFKMDVLEHSGKILSDLKNVSELKLGSQERVFYVMKDGDNYSQDFNNFKDQITPVSTRFISYCV